MVSQWDLKHHEQRENNRLAILLLAGAVSNFTWPYALVQLNPDQIEHWGVRLVLSLICLFCLAAVLYLKPSNRMRDWFVLIPCISLTVYAYTLFTESGWHVHHVIGTTIVATVAYMLLFSKWAVAVYSLSLLATFGWAALENQNNVHPLLPLLWCGTIMLVGLVANFMRMQLVHDLLNAELASRTILAHLGEGVVVHGPDRRIIYHNNRVCEVLGLSSEQVLGRVNADPIFQTFDESGHVIPPEKHPSSIALSTGQSVLNFSMNVRRPDATIARILVNAIPMYKENTSKPDYVVVTFQDVTSLKAIQTELDHKQSLLVANSKLSSLGEMASGVAHEINNPLSIISLSAEYLSHLVDAPQIDANKLKSEVQSIVKNVQRATKVIKSMSSLARDGVKDPFESASVKTIVEDTLLLVADQLRKRDVKIEVQADPNLKVLCRPGQLSQLVLNLVQNAIDATVDLPHPQIWVKVAKKEKLVDLRISNNGPLPTNDVVKRMGQPFFTTKPPGKGIGLGLSISRNIAKAHGGSLEFALDEGRVHFIVTLPLIVQSANSDAA